MRYDGIKCEKCGIEFTADDDVVVCPICGAPHHRGCWLEQNACTHSEEHTAGYQWQMPEMPKTEPEEKKTPLPNEFILKNGESVITCPRCGSLNCENDVYCMRCGSPLRGQEENANEEFRQDDEQNAYNRQNRQRERMYADFNRYGGLDPNSELDGIPVVEYSDFVGGKTPGKIIRKISVMERFGKNLQTCWPALLIGPVWFFWRKMKKEGLIFSAVLLVLCICCGFLQINAPLEKYYKDTFDLFSRTVEGELTAEEMKEEMEEISNIYYYAELTPEEERRSMIASLFSYAAEPGISLACAFSAMYFYRKKVKSSVLNIRERCTNMEQYADTLRAEGGTSAGLAVFGAILFAAAFFCRSYLPMLIILFR